MPGLGGLFGNRGGMGARPASPFTNALGGQFQGPFTFGGQQYTPVNPADMAPMSVQGDMPMQNPARPVLPGGMPMGSQPNANRFRFTIPGLQDLNGGPNLYGNSARTGGWSINAPRVSSGSVPVKPAPPQPINAPKPGNVVTPVNRRPPPTNAR